MRRSGASPSCKAPSDRGPDGTWPASLFGNGPERSERIKPLFATFSVFDFVKNRAQPFVMIYECFTIMSFLQSAMNLHVHPIYFPSRDGWEGVVYPQCRAKFALS